MKISPEVEQRLISAIEETENFFSGAKEVFAKLIRGFYWLYLIGLSIFWIVEVFLTFRYQIGDSSSWVWIILTAGGVVALYSYLNEVYIAHTHFWKAWLLLTIIIYFTSLSFVAIPALILMFPTLYGLYYVGFKNEEHKLFCLIKEVNVVKWDRAIYDQEMKLPPESKKISDLEALRFIITGFYILPPRGWFRKEIS